jgi:hypothetical protein
MLPLATSLRIQDLLGLAEHILRQILDRPIRDDKGLAVLHTGRLLALLNALVTQVAKLGYRGHEQVFPFVFVDLPWPDLCDLHPRLSKGEVELLVARELTGEASCAVFVIDE